jgi:tRNA-uridine 2-sulfurtransferase
MNNVSSKLSNTRKVYRIMVKAVGLLSGGLDSILAIRVLQDQNIHIIGVSFVTPFFGSKRAESAAKILNIDLRIINISKIHIEMLRSPKHGYGKEMNPCIDCHALMFHEAGKLMEAENADFLFSGEVLGERPMSQNFQSLMKVANDSGYKDFIVRPLSARLLPETSPEHEGKVDREMLLDISGRSRKRQVELAKHYGITEYAQPAGGCLLTDPAYSSRLRELMDKKPDFDIRDAELLAIGRHFRLDTGEKIIVGRNQSDNEMLMSLKTDDDVIIDIAEYPSPIIMIPNSGSEEAIKIAASICVLYSDSPQGDAIQVSYDYKGKSNILFTESFIKDDLEKIRI